MAVDLLRFIKEKWFLLGLLAISCLTLVDGTGTVAGLGKWFKTHHGADAVILLIFFCSGLILRGEDILRGIVDAKGTLIAMAIIFGIAPCIAYLVGMAPLDPGVRIGLFLVAVMPTTMSSGVVMTGAAGGNIAHALLISVVANGLSMFTVPISLALMLNVGGDSSALLIDKGKMMIQIGLLVLVPLALGLVLRPNKVRVAAFLRGGVPVFNQCLILSMIWMALSEARPTVLSSGTQTIVTVALSFLFHALLLATTFGAAFLFGLGPGRRESVVFMGGQKTLVLSVLLQVKLFPDYGLALVFCVVHHFVHLMMDGYLVGWLRARSGNHVRQKGR
jgi:sodium/bile acid cotransporter 7